MKSIDDVIKAYDICLNERSCDDCPYTEHDAEGKWACSLCGNCTEDVLQYLKAYRDDRTAEPERKKGKWIDDGSEFGCCCSECSETLDNYFDGALYEIRMNKIPNFCPNCGAEMRGE